MIAAVMAFSVFPAALGLMPFIHCGSLVTSSLDVSQTSEPRVLRLLRFSGLGEETGWNLTWGMVLERWVWRSVGKYVSLEWR